MHNIKTISSFSKAFSIMALGVLIISCNSSTSNTESEVIGQDRNKIIITKKQFESSGMALGKLEESVFSSTVHANGMVDVPPENKASISTYYGGFVERLNLLPGEHIKKGQILFTLGNPEYVQMQQDYLEAKNKLSYLKADYERQQALAKENIASQKNFLKAKTEYSVTLARYESLRKKLQLINISPAQVTENNLQTVIAIYAPISGYITKVHATKGMYINPSDVAVEIVNADHIHLELNVYEKDIQKVKEEQPIRFQLPDAGGTWYDAEVHLVGKTVEDENRTINVHGHLIDESLSRLFVPGMYVEAQIAVSNERTLSLPEEAVVNIDDKYYVLVLDKGTDTNFTFDRREVIIGKNQNKLTEIRNADQFKATDQILIKGAFNLII